jgi:hypothetical protein
VAATPPDRTDPSNPEVIDDLRQRLRALGYLDAGVDRFVLGAARRHERPSALALSASVRIGGLAAVLLGPAAAVGLAARLPGLVTGPRDAVVAAVFLGILFGAFAAVAAFLASLATSWIATRTALTGPRMERRTRWLSLAAGIVVSAGSLAYLTLWWRSANAGLGWAAPVWTIFALAVAAAISLLLGHAVTVTALVMTMMRPERDLKSAGVPGGSWKAVVAGGAIAFAGAAILLFATAGADRPDGRSERLTVASTGSTLVVIAVDGFDATLYERFRADAAEDGPGLSAVFDAARAELAPYESRDPARLWTTIATGVRAETHGVGALETRRIAGLHGRLGSGSTARVIGAATDVLRLTRPAIASNFERRVKAFWEVAEQAGLRAGVVNWWATWPAAASDGRVITDRAVLRLERGGPLDAEIAPADLYEPLKARWTEIRARARQQAQEQLAVRSQRESPAATGELQAVLTRSAELDASMIELARAIAEDGRLDLLVVYLPGLDIAQHTLLGGESGPAPSELGVRVAALQRYYAFLDVLTSNAIAEAMSKQQRVFVITQAGRQHKGAGILAGVGPGLRSGARVSASQATAMDVAPTILHALGVPIARDLDGRVVGDLFQAGSLDRHPVRFVATYGPRGAIAAVRGDAPLDQETIDRLRSLGYVK